MRILAYEFASGGGLAGRPVPASLAREGRAMLTALVADLARIGRHEIVTTADRRFTLHAPRGVDVVTVGPGGVALLDDLIASVDAVWLIAPETDGWLEGLAAKVERTGRMLLGTGSAAIRRAADKQRLPNRLARCGLPHPPTRVVHRHAEARAIADDLGYPVIVKPARGAGCGGVCLAKTPRDLQAAIERATGCSAGLSAPRRGPERAALRLATAQRSCRAKFTVTVITTGTGSRFSSAGANRHCRTAATAAWSSGGIDRSTRTDSTIPCASMTASRMTTPSTLDACAMAG